MDSMSPQQQDCLSRGAGQQENKRRMKSQSYRRQSAPSLVITKALTRSKTLSRESFLVPVCPETCQLVQSFLADPDRSFLLHGHAQLKTGMQTQDRHLFLFTDILVVAKAKSANHFKQKACVCVCEMWTASCTDEVCEGSTSPERSFVMGWPTWNCAAMFSSSEQKEKWLSILKSRIKEEKEKEEPKTIPLRVYGKGINTFAVTKTLPVSNSDSTNEVIRLALQQFGIIGNVKDFQLWVISKRDNTPYPLIGHEFPFSIQMSHVRQSAPQTGGGRDAVASPEERQKAMQVEQLQVNRQCQFILKPRPAEPQQQDAYADVSQKPFKRRRSLITWAFWRGSAPHLNETSLAPRGCLFGQPMSSVCVDESLPKPVMDMLTFLYHEGPWTRGIFRRPAGARAVRELRDSLDAGGVWLPLTRDHAFVIAGVFKDFLRSIPGSLLSCELYEEWMDVLEEEEEEEEQVQDIQRMIGRLPKESGLLLRYLLAVLHAIRGNAHENQMTSFNLSVCIAPSMLWPPGAPCSPEVEGEGTKKVCALVKFMIEHIEQILCEEPSSLFGGPPQRRGEEETESESWVYPLTDSSYDSLENELDNSSGGSPGICTGRRLGPEPLQGSLDSILTFSDYDQDTEPDFRNKQTVDPDVRLRGKCDAPTVESLSLEGPHSQQRRRSEPAISYLTEFRPCTSGSTDGLTGDDEDGEEEYSKNRSRRALTKSRCTGQVGRTRGDSATAALKNSSSSLSSTPVSPTPVSPAHTRSSHDSLDSLSGDQTWVARLQPTKTHLMSTSVSPQLTLDSTLPSADSLPKEPVNRGAFKAHRGLHPNSWLKKDRRLSLTHQDTPETAEGDKTEGELAEKHGKKQAAKNAKSSGGGHVRGRHLKSIPHHHSTGNLQLPKSSPFTPSQSDNAEGTPPKLTSPSLFYKQSGPSLSLFRQSKSHSVEGEAGKARLFQRRGSEPGQRAAERAATKTRARLPSDPGLKVSQVDAQGEAQFCLSPSATKAVRDYFSSHPRSHPKSGQQVALALVESRREWLKRCSDPTAEPDFEQLLLAEESYV